MSSDQSTETGSGTGSVTSQNNSDTAAQSVQQGAEKRKPDQDIENLAGDSSKRFKPEDNLKAAESSSGEKDDADTSPQRKDGKSTTEQEKMNEYSYTKSGDFTSELFKIKVTNLPRNYGFAEVKKRMEKDMGLKPHKIKCTHGTNVVYICFANEEDRQLALKRVNKYTWKGRHLRAERANPAPDPYYRAHGQNSEDSAESDSFKRRRGKRAGAQKKLEAAARQKDAITKVEKPKLDSNASLEEAETRLKESVTPYYNLDYDEQLEAKYNTCRDSLKKLVLHPFVRGLEMYRDKTKNFGMACPLLDVVPAPVKFGYRNKNEFTIGHSLDGKSIIVGFRYGMYKDGITAVGRAECLRVAMPHAEKVARSFEELVKQTGYGVFQYQTFKGHWQTLMVRTFSTGDCMVMVDFVKRNLSQDKLTELKEKIKHYYTEGEGKDVHISSFYFRLTPVKGEAKPEDKTLVFGEPYIHEEVLGHRFRVSAEAFFQVNTAATEKLYSIVQDWSGVGENTVILDACCGTGTIGLSLAKKVKEVIGIDNCPQAIEDAKANAELNGVTNATYYCSKVEDILPKIMSSFKSSPEIQIVAIVDPPRCGLFKTVIKSLRKHRGIQRLVYVSCKSDMCIDNFADLIRLPTNNLPGTPFKVLKAIPVDLFPSARHCEMVLLFERDTTGMQDKDDKSD